MVRLPETTEGGILATALVMISCRALTNRSSGDKSSGAGVSLARHEGRQIPTEAHLELHPQAIEELDVVLDRSTVHPATQGLG